MNEFKRYGLDKRIIGVHFCGYHDGQFSAPYPDYSVHALKSGPYDFKLPFPAKVVNLKSGNEEPHRDGVITLELAAGQTCWFRLD